MRNNIPACPKKNLERVESICNHWRRKLEAKKLKRDDIRSKLDSIRELIVADEEAEETTQEAENRKTIARKYEFELYGSYGTGGLTKEIRTLSGKIKWAERNQIPFLKSEVARIASKDSIKAYMETVLDGTVDTAVDETLAEVAEEDLDGTIESDTMLSEI